MPRALLVFIVVSAVLWRNSLQQGQLPPNDCPNYFEYERYGNEIVGKITISHIASDNVVVVAMFSQREPTRTEYSGRLTLYQDETTTLHNIQTGQPVSYRVHFPIAGVAPKLTQIAVNGAVLCSANQYRPPSVILTLQHKLQTVNTRSGATPFITAQTRPAFLQAQPAATPPPAPPFRQTAVGPPAQAPIQQGANIASCGQEGNGFVPFIYGGSIVSRGRFPWLTPVYQKNGGDLKFICGGSLISSQTVLTAGHCFSLTSIGTSQIVVSVGRYKLDSFTEDGYQTRELRDLIINPEYNQNSYPDADIAILLLSTPVTFTQFVQPICLWRQAADDVVGQTAIVAGWGAEENGNQVSPVPKMVDTNIVSTVQCLQRGIDSDLITERTLCAGKLDGTGPCHGDSGGGLMMKRNGRWLLRGIVSAGRAKNVRGCDLEQYVVYCDLAKHRTWIESRMLP